MTDTTTALLTAAASIKVAKCILREADILRRTGNRLMAQALLLRCDAIAACKEKPDEIDQQTWEIFKCSNE